MAKGKPDARGPGCSEWIAAEGDFDSGAGERFIQFLETLPNPRLPVFFHSRGGILGAGLTIGETLRDRGITAGVGRTVRVSGGKRRERGHQIVFGGVVCASACVYAFIGASRREISPRARLGVHASRILAKLNTDEINEANTALRVYMLAKGVDDSFVDFIKKTPNSTVHWLSRREIARFGIVSDKPFETRWRRFRLRDAHFAMKALTSGANAARRTTFIEVSCFGPNYVKVSLVRDFTDTEFGSQSDLWLKSERKMLLDSGSRLQDSIKVPEPNKLYEVRNRSVPLDQILDAAAGRSLLMAELFTKPNQGS